VATVMGTTTPSGAVCNTATDSVTTDVFLPPQGSFDCKDAKPIDELTMIWNPDPLSPNQNVCVRAFLGAAHGSQLQVFTDVAPGDVVKVNGMGGSPNDQEWVIYPVEDCLTTPLGVSRFHISCSDGNMNGIEDCGKALGDSKDDDPSFINDWLFEGMKGDKTLDCTPDPILADPAWAEDCGLGSELALLLPGLMWMRRRLRRRAAAAA
jgi:hypothetical protein